MGSRTGEKCLGWGGRGNLRGTRHSLQGSYICGHNYLLRLILSFHTASERLHIQYVQWERKQEILRRLKLTNVIPGVLLSSSSMLVLSLR